MRRFPYTSAGHAIRWLPCKNVDSETAPALAVMQVQGIEDGAILVSKPDLTGAIDLTVVNGPSPIPVDGYGECSRDWPLRAKLDETYPGPWGGGFFGYTVTAGSWHLVWDSSSNWYSRQKFLAAQSDNRTTPFFVPGTWIYAITPVGNWFFL